MKKKTLINACSFIDIGKHTFINKIFTITNHTKLAGLYKFQHSLIAIHSVPIEVAHLDIKNELGLQLLT